METHELQKYQQIARQLLANRGWNLVEDEDAFVVEVREEYLRRLKLPDESKRPEKEIIQRATINRYCHRWYDACCEDGTDRQQQAFRELNSYLYPIALYRAHGDKHIAQESTQNTLLRVYKNLWRVRDPGGFAAYAGVAVTRFVIRMIREREREAEKERQAANESQEIAEPPKRLQPGRVLKHLSLTDELRAFVEVTMRDCLKRSQKRQEVMIGQFLDNKGVQQLADELSMRPNNIYLLTHRAWKNLRECEKFIALFEELILRGGIEND